MGQRETCCSARGFEAWDMMSPRGNIEGHLGDRGAERTVSHALAACNSASAPIQIVRKNVAHWACGTRVLAYRWEPSPSLISSATSAAMSRL